MMRILVMHQTLLQEHNLIWLHGCQPAMSQHSLL